MSDYLTIREAEQVSGIYRRRFYRAEKKGLLRFHYADGHPHIHREELDQLKQSIDKKSKSNVIQN